MFLRRLSTDSPGRVEGEFDGQSSRYILIFRCVVHAFELWSMLLNCVHTFESWSILLNRDPYF